MSELTDRVGFSEITNQLYRKLVKKGFNFNLLLVGESGLGKSTFINSLFLTEIYDSHNLGPSNRVGSTQTTKVDKHDIFLHENGIDLRLGIIDTPGFGDFINNQEAFDPILQYIEQQNSAFLANESRLFRRMDYQDERIHACLYFLPPRVHGLRQIDIQFMQKLHEEVTIIPIIAKGDTLTLEEKHQMKLRVRQQIEQYGITTYFFPKTQPEEYSSYDMMQPDYNTQDHFISNERDYYSPYVVDLMRQPFSVVGSNAIMDGRLRARKYPWGIVDVDNPDHSDLKDLRDCLFKTNMYHLIDVTHTYWG